MVPVVWMVSVAAYAQTDAAAVVSAVEAKYAKVESIKAGFVQVTRSKVFGEERQEGLVSLKRPRMMRWEFTSGEGRQFVTDGTTMWVYSKADRQVIKYTDVAASGGSAADSLLQSLDRLNEVFEVKLLSQEGGYTLELHPRAKDQPVKAITLVLDPSYVLKGLTLIDGFDTATELTFSNVQLRATMSDDVFQFTVPAGVEVIAGG